MEPEEIPKQISWDYVRMLNIDELSITVLLRGEAHPKTYHFKTREEKEATLRSWFNNGRRE